ncbi:MAG TPA: 3-deoxy-7-phosphoheptulonate synthase [Lentisphaeria bacterium]|nr:3-deoxy-7-phosphoheptulonate synthase [Lentisphaeria bacterium]
MHQTTDDLRIAALRPLLSPAILMEEFPITDDLSNVVVNTREATSAVIRGDDDRLIVVVGPCSIHNPRAALEYAGLLQPYHAKLGGELCIVMRVYFEKPRTTVGWKGLINDPDLDGSFNINSGLHQARKLLLDIGEIGLPVGSEFLDTIMPQFIADLISWGAIGARTTESQVHRELASGLSMPVGFKNATNGNVQVVADAIGAAKHRHHFLSVTKQGISAIVATSGNDSCHAILRGSTQGPNYDEESVRQTAALLTQAGVNPRLMIDCSHGNSAKDPERQPAIAQDIAAQVAGGSRDIIGVMLESNLLGGSQSLNDPSKLVYGQSITDACLSWKQTVPVLEDLALAASRRRER